MWYHMSVSVPANTPEDEPVEQVLRVTSGVIVYLGVGFPSGCKQLVRVRIYHWEHQIFPINADESAAWNNGIEGGQYHYVLDEPPFELTIRAYSPGTTSSHTITVFVNILPVEVAESWATQSGQLDELRSMLGV